MAALANYTDLVTEAQDWLFGRTDIVAKVPTFVRMTEAKINRTLMVRQMELRARASVDPGSDEPEFITLPGDFQAMRRVRMPAVAGKPRLKFATGTQLDDISNRDRSPAGTPVWFTILGDEMELYPVPGSAVELEMVYRKNVPALGVDNATNWLLTLAPDLYLYGTLMEAAPYLHEDERIITWAAGVKSAIDQLNALSLESTYNAGPLVMRRKGRSY